MLQLLNYALILYLYLILVLYVHINSKKDFTKCSTFVLNSCEHVAWDCGLGFSFL